MKNRTVKQILLIFVGLILCQFQVFSDSISDELLNADSRALEIGLKKYTWIPQPWALEVYSITSVTFHDKIGELYLGRALFEVGYEFTYSVTDKIITIENITVKFPDKKRHNGKVMYKIYPNITIDGPLVLRKIGGDYDNEEIFPNTLYAMELRNNQSGTRVFENFYILWNDKPSEAIKDADLFGAPNSGVPINLKYRFDDPATYTENSFNSFKAISTGELSIIWLGSSIYEGKKWYLGYLFFDSGDKDGQMAKFVWSSGSPEWYPKVIVDYYNYINTNNLAKAFSLWHQKRNFDYFRNLYSDTKIILPLQFAKLSNDKWEVKSKVIFLDGTFKYYKTLFIVNNEKILDSQSIEINENQLYD